MTLYAYIWVLMGTAYKDLSNMPQWNKETVELFRGLDHNSPKYSSRTKNGRLMPAIEIVHDLYIM